MGLLLLLIFSSAAPAQAPAASGQPLVTIEAQGLGAEEYYPPPKPPIYLRGEWLRAASGCLHLSPGDLGDDDIENDSAPRVRVAVHHTERLVSDAELKMTQEHSLERVKKLLCHIRNQHMSSGNSDGSPWSDIGYHYLIDWDGRIWQGRRVEKKGASVQSFNNGTIGVALFGNFENQHPTPEQMRALKRWLAYLVYAYKIPPTSIFGHHQFNSTQCPGRNLERHNEFLEPYVADKASPLRRIRMALTSLWARMRRGSPPGPRPPGFILPSPGVALSPQARMFDGAR